MAWTDPAKVLASKSGTASSATHATDSFTPTVGDLLIPVAKSHIGNATLAEISFSDTFAGFAFTRIIHERFGDGVSTKTVNVAAAYGIVSASPGAGIVTAERHAPSDPTTPVAANRWWIDVYRIPAGEFDPADPIGVSNGNNVSTATALQVVLSGGTAGNLFLAFLGVRNATAVTGDGSYTTLSDLTVGSAPPFRTHDSFDKTDPLDGTVDWTSMTSGQAAAGIVIEINAAPTVTAKAGSDTLTVGTTDASSSLGAASTLSDTATVGITDASALLAASAVNDNPTIGITDAGSVAGNANVNDPLNLGVTDTGSIAATLSATDTLTVGITDSAAIFEFVAKDVADSLGLGLTEATAIAAQLSTNDPLSISVSEALTLSSQVQGADSLGLTLQEAVALGATVQAADALNLSLTDTIGLFANLEASDVLEISFIGDGAIPSGAVERNLVWLAGNPRHKWVFGSLEAKWNTGKPRTKWKLGEPQE